MEKIEYESIEDIKKTSNVLEVVFYYVQNY